MNYEKPFLLLKHEGKKKTFIRKLSQLSYPCNIPANRACAEGLLCCPVIYLFTVLGWVYLNSYKRIFKNTVRTPALLQNFCPSESTHYITFISWLFCLYISTFFMPQTKYLFDTTGCWWTVIFFLLVRLHLVNAN